MRHMVPGKLAPTRALGFLLLAFASVLALASPAAASPPKADVVFILDESGSMGDEIDAVREHIIAIASAASAQMDARYALVGFGGASPGVPPNEPFTRTDFTTRDGLATALEQAGAYAGGGGGTEVGLYATSYALTAMSGFRTDAGTCAVLLSDEAPSFKVDLATDLSEAIAALSSRNATWFGVVPTSMALVRTTYGADEGSLAYMSGGAVFAMGGFLGDPSGVLEAIITKCARFAQETSRCTITGTFGADVLAGTPGPDVICGLAGDDVVSARGGNDTVYGGIGNDVVTGGTGTDRVFGGPGTDRLVGGLGADVLSGGFGADRLLGRDGVDTLRGGAGGDVVIGGGGRDVMRGNDGRDRMNARDGRRDDVAGGAGTDVGLIDARLDSVRSVERLR